MLTRFVQIVFLTFIALVTPFSSQAATLLPGVFQGNAYGTFANVKVGPLKTQLGRSALISIGCTGRDGISRSNSINTTAVAGVLGTGTIFTNLTTSKTATG